MNEKLEEVHFSRSLSGHIIWQHFKSKTSGIIEGDELFPVPVRKIPHEPRKKKEAAQHDAYSHLEDLAAVLHSTFDSNCLDDDPDGQGKQQQVEDGGDEHPGEQDLLGAEEDVHQQDDGEEDELG